MNQRSAVSIGPGASSLILIFVCLALSILGMLSLLTARNDLKFSERSAEVIQSVYQLNEQAETRRAEIERILGDAAESTESEADLFAAAEGVLPEDAEIFEDEISWTEEIRISLDIDTQNAGTISGRILTLDCALQIRPENESERTQWIRHDLTVYTENDEWNW